MLKGISPLISPELMLVLMRMGHGDEIVIGDGNFPADANAERIVRADGLSVLDLLPAVLAHFPLDTFVEHAAFVMQPVDPDAPEPPIWGEYRRLLIEAEGRVVKLAPVERFDFYRRTREAYAVVATSETALYANLILKKGVVPPED